MERLLNELRRRRGNQKGFTLIEMLVVISILGILAAVVTMSMVGVTNFARSNAQKAEKQTIQVALDTMANANNVPAATVCPSPGVFTNDMSSFPQSGAEPLYPKYLRIKTTTQQSYACDADGTVHGSVTP